MSSEFMGLIEWMERQVIKSIAIPGSRFPEPLSGCSFVDGYKGLLPAWEDAFVRKWKKDVEPLVKAFVEEFWGRMRK